MFRNLGSRAVRNGFILAIGVVAAVFAVPSEAWKHGFAQAISGTAGQIAYYASNGTIVSGLNSGIINVNQSSVGMTANNTTAGFDNGALVSTLMAAVSPTPSGYGRYSGTTINFPAIAGLTTTTEYYFASPLSLTRSVNLECSGGGAASTWPGVALVFAAGIDGVVFEDLSTSSDGGTSDGRMAHCNIASLGFGLGTLVAGSNQITNVSMVGTRTIAPVPFAANDGIMGTYEASVNTVTPDLPPGSYVVSASGTAGNQTLTLQIGQFSNYNGPSGAHLWRLPAALRSTVTTTAGSTTFTVTSGSYCFQPSDMIWSDAWYWGATVRTVTGLCGAQTVTVGDAFLTPGTTALYAGVTHNGSTASFGPDVSGAAGTALASATAAGSSAASAFPGPNGVSSTGWGNTGTLPAWLLYDFGSNTQILTGYSLMRTTVHVPFDGTDNYSPASWTFQGSNDSSTCLNSGGSTWTTLDTKTGQSILRATGIPSFYTFSNSTAYRCYRINITAATSGNTTNISKMTLNIASTPNGYIWRVPAGIKFRATAKVNDMTSFYFPLGIQISCGTLNALNCTSSEVQGSLTADALVGRWTSGNNVGASVFIHNNYQHSGINDIFEGESFGSASIGESSNSGIAVPIAGNCQNIASPYLGMYVESTSAGYTYCQASQMDITKGTSAPLFIGPVAPNMPLDVGMHSGGQLTSYWMQVAPVNLSTLNSLKPCDASHTSNVGAIAMVHDGANSPTYNAAASSAGSAIEPVACTYNGTSYGWTYH